MGKPRKTTTEGADTKKVTTPPVKETEDKEEKVTVEKPVKEAKTKPVTQSTEIKDDEEIDVVSLDSNVYYYDKTTDETYVWSEVGDVVFLPFAVIKNMWRNHKDYFRNFILKPRDKRVVAKLGLTKTYEKYNFLNDGSQYTKKNIDEIIRTIDSASSGFKVSICNNIKNMIVDGEITNVNVIRQLGKYFDVDFISLLD